MNYSFKLRKALGIGLVCFAISFCTVSCADKGASLELDETSTINVEDFLPNTNTGNLIKQHLRLAMGSGADAEANYQQSLQRLKANPEAGRVLFNSYKKVPAQHYMYRTMLVEALKQLQSSASMAYLNEIASERIPKDTAPQNAELDTRIDEIVIRITAVEGLTLLASDSLIDASSALMGLTSHADLTVRQMAARGYIKSPVGSVVEKIDVLRSKLPKSEHWYLSLEDTNIKTVEHPEMPDEFEIIEKEVKNSPKIKQQ